MSAFLHMFLQSLILICSACRGSPTEPRRRKPGVWRSGQLWMPCVLKWTQQTRYLQLQTNAHISSISHETQKLVFYLPVGYKMKKSFCSCAGLIVGNVLNLKRMLWYSYKHPLLTWLFKGRCQAFLCFQIALCRVLKPSEL